jgi:hypothetical protein
MIKHTNNHWKGQSHTDHIRGVIKMKPDEWVVVVGGEWGNIQNDTIVGGRV